MEKNIRHDQAYFNDNLDRILDCARFGRNILLHGPGGVGKTYILRHVAKSLTLDGKIVYMTAMTGVAALNLAGDRTVQGLTVTTLHRFAGVGTAQLDVPSLIARVKSYPGRVKKWRKCQILIIDEVSMLGAELFKKFDAIAKNIRGNDLPFGGIQLILSGDLLQLSPVKDAWVFTAQEWTDLNIRPFVMEVPYRYTDMKFFEMLLRIRTGTQTEDDCKTIRGRVRANVKMQEILATLAKEKAGEIIKPTMFFSKNVDVNGFNMKELDKLEGDEVVFSARDSFTVKKGNPVREEYIKMLDDAIPHTIVLKIGAQVMLKKNLDVDEGLVNGSRGVVSEIIEGEAIVVKFLSGIKIRVDLQEWDYEDKYGIAKRVQLPFLLAWGCTIHKSQGTTLDYAVLDLGPSVFCSGQAYVALSRCKNLEGLFISEFTARSIIVSTEALKYMFQINKMYELENEEK